MSESKGHYWRAIEHLFEEVDIYNDEEAFFVSIAPLVRSRVLVYAALFCLSEVHNGGFLQFFWNSTGILAPEAIEGFKLIEMPRLASVLETAAAPLGSPYPRGREARWDAMLNASGLEASELENIFMNAPDLYSAYLGATKGLGWDALNEQAWKLAETENGDFQMAADRYAAALEAPRNN